jgi:hypothetical protein
MADSQPTQFSLLVRLRNADDGPAWAEFLEIYTPAVYGFARKCGLQDADASDVTQDVFRTVFDSISKFQCSRELAQVQQPSEAATTAASRSAGDIGSVKSGKWRIVHLTVVARVVVTAPTAAAFWLIPVRPSLIATREYDGRVYKLYALDRAITRHEAERWAVRAGGHLATITSEAENQFILDLIDQAEGWTTERSTQWGPWIGAIQREGMANPSSGAPRTVRTLCIQR